MEKLIYLLWNGSGRLADDEAAALLGPARDELAALGVPGLSMDLADAGAAGVQLPLPPPPDDPGPAALVAVWLDCHDDRGPVEAILAPHAERLAGYLVTESVPTDYGDNQWAAPRDWPDGTRSPGVVMLTLMEKPDRLDDGAWYHHWYGTQTPMSTAIQPRIRYVRNAVARPLTDGAPPYRGIVEEAWPSVDHVNDPMLFYCAGGDDEVLAANMTTMIESVTAFLDLDRIRCAAMSEYLLVTP
ncbi:MAG TPA: hypothetical protein VMT43_09050 [Acidimicrobiales bacterium]|nr:hypothetical protein [Acidimicrobiales bacterium]